MHIKHNFYVTKRYLHIKIIRIESILSRNFVFMNKINEWVSFIFIIIISSNSTGSSDRSFYPIFNKKFDYLETLLTIHRPKKVHCAGLQCPVTSLNVPKGPSSYRKSIIFRFQICHHSHLNASYKTKTNIDFKGQAWVRPPAKCFILTHKYHAPNFYRRF